jgi:glycosyltransferase involved in cell wall biosynthesis
VSDRTSDDSNFTPKSRHFTELGRGLGALMLDPVAETLLNDTRSAQDVSPTLRHELEEYRSSEAYRLVYEKNEPLVSICICTHNRARLVSERTIPSALAQDYPNLEVVVIGDGCTDDTEEAVLRLGDPRVRFVGTARGDYPRHPFLRWLVAGTIPMNFARTIAKGDLITHLDDDDEFTPDRLTKLVRLLQETRAELVWHPFWTEMEPDRWMQWGGPEFRAGHVTSGSVLYLSWFKRLEFDPKSYRYLEPGDWNFYRKVAHIGTKLARHPEALLRHHRERDQ